MTDTSGTSVHTELRRRQEEELVLLSELAHRRGGDPLLTFVPHEKQKLFIDACFQGPRDENWFFAANRAGKTDAGAYVGASLARFGDQGDDVRWVGGQESGVQIRDRATSGWVSCLDFPTSRDVVQPKYFDNGFVPPGVSHQPFIPAREIAKDGWRISDQVLQLKNGSIIGFKSVESGAKKYQGAGLDWVHLDEEHPQEVYNEVSIRVGSRKLRIFGTATLLPPQGQVGGVSWMFQSIIKPWLDGKLTRLSIFTASIYDNPVIPISEIEKLESLYPEGSAERRIRLNGELLPGLSGSRAYPAFNALVNVRPQPDIVLRRPLCWTWDFNVDPMCSLVCQRERLPNNKTLFRVYKELVIHGSGNVPDMCEMFYNYHPRHDAELWLFGDSTSKGRSKQTGKSDYTVILNTMRQFRVPLKMRVPETNPSIPDRLAAVNRVCRDEDAEIRLEIDPSCVELISDLETVLRDGRGGIKKTYNTRDMYAKRTHTSDALGYWISYEEPVQRITQEQTVRIKTINPAYGFKAVQGPAS